MVIHRCRPPSDVPPVDSNKTWACPACGRIWEVQSRSVDREKQPETTWVPVGRT
jgi:hypothetical protein